MWSRLPRFLWIGAVLFVAGSGPLLTIIVAAELGLTRDPNPNPIGFGLLAGLTFWPAVILMFIGLIKARRKAPAGTEPPKLEL